MLGSGLVCLRQPLVPVALARVASAFRSRVTRTEAKRLVNDLRLVAIRQADQAPDAVVAVGGTTMLLKEIHDTLWNRQRHDSNNPTRSLTSHSRSVTPAAITGVVRKLW